MDFQAFIEEFEQIARVASFDFLPDGSHWDKGACHRAHPECVRR